MLSEILQKLDSSIAIISTQVYIRYATVRDKEHYMGYELISLVQNTLRKRTDISGGKFGGEFYEALRVLKKIDG